jgi:hypothetical protein
MTGALAVLWSSGAAAELAKLAATDRPAAARVEAAVQAIARGERPVVDGDWTGRRAADRRSVRLLLVGGTVVELAAGPAEGRYVRVLTVRPRHSSR